MAALGEAVRDWRWGMMRQAMDRNGWDAIGFTGREQPVAGGQADLLGQFAPNRCFGGFTAPDPATRKIPFISIRGAHQQQSLPDMDRREGALMRPAPEPPPPENMS